jgi:elongation factor G
VNNKNRYLEPLGYDQPSEFVNGLIGNNIPPAFLSAIEKGFNEAVEKGPLIGHPVQGVRFVVTDGMAHSVDSNELSFRLASIGAFRIGMFLTLSLFL